MATPTDPICGHCGGPRSGHEERWDGALYCYATTNGDYFSDEPDPDALIELIQEHHPDAYEDAVRRWRVENGHEPGDES